MPTPISTLPLSELVEMYRHAAALKEKMQREPYLCMWYRLTELEVDMDLLWQAMEPKIPGSHTYAIYSLMQQLNR